jgi:hypothetical protein
MVSKPSNSPAFLSAAGEAAVRELYSRSACRASSAGQGQLEDTGWSHILPWGLWPEITHSDATALQVIRSIEALMSAELPCLILLPSDSALSSDYDAAWTGGGTLVGTIGPSYTFLSRCKVLEGTKYSSSFQEVQYSAGKC